MSGIDFLVEDFVFGWALSNVDAWFLISGR